jgi:hypothetical protein
MSSIRRPQRDTPYLRGRQTKSGLRFLLAVGQDISAIVSCRKKKAQAFWETSYEIR